MAPAGESRGLSVSTSASRPIFIGGTGRSGTTILYRALGCHPEIFALPREMRFITDHGGLMNLVDALTSRFSHVQAREAVDDFDLLMRVQLATPDGPDYPGYDLPTWLGEDHYFEQLDEFLGHLVAFEFHGLRAPLRIRRQESGRRRWPNIRLREKTRPIRQRGLPLSRVPVVKYFPERAALVQLAATFVDELFSLPARAAGKAIWCEKSPSNLQNLDFLLEMFPDAQFIHMVRDPRDVVASMKKVNWAPGQVKQIVLFLEQIYGRWETLKATLPLNERNYLQIKLEDFAREPRRHLTQIAEFSGLSDHFQGLPDIKAEAVQAHELSGSELDLIDLELGKVRRQYGYE
jgi:hypothetical protein